METIEEHDIVMTNQPFGYIPKNATGTVVHIYNEDMVEVEFDFLGSTVVETISTKFLKKKE